MSTNVGEIDLSLILNSDKFRKELNSLPSIANNAANKLSAPLEKIGKMVLAAFSVRAIINFGKACLQASTEAANGMIGLKSILDGQGRSFSQAQKFIDEYISDGLVPLNNAVNSYKNLALRGYSSEQIQKTMTALKNSATFARQSTYSLGDAVQTATEGLKNENSVVVDNAGVTKNVAKMWEEYAASIGKTKNQLTQAEKIQAEVNGILEETKFQSNDAAKYAETYSGAVAKLSSSFTNMKIAIGNVIQPIAKLFIPVITAAVNAVTRLFTALAGLLSLFGLKADSVKTVGSNMEGVASGAEKAGGALDKAGNSASKAGKKAKGSLASWDELNVLNKTDDSGSGGGTGGGGAGAGGIADSLDVSAEVEEDTSKFNGLIDKLKEIRDIFKEGFEASFGDTNFDGILTHLSNIKKELKDIFTDPDVINSAEQWVDTQVYALGQMVGAVARIGVNITEGLLGSIDYYLSQNIDRIKTHICNMFDITSETAMIEGNFWQVLGEISDVFSSDIAKQIGADFIAMIANPIMSIREIGAKFARDLDLLFLQPIIDNGKKIQTSIENTLVPIQTVTGEIAQSFTDLGDSLNEMYDAHIKPLFESLSAGFSDTFSKFLDVYNEYIVPVLQSMADKFSEVWDEKIHPMLENFIELIGKVADLIKTLWETILKPVVDWIVSNVLPAVANVYQTLWNGLMEFFGYVSETINGIIEILQGIIDFIVGVFTGDWQRAWDGIKEIFNGIWEAIKGIVSAAWSLITTIITTAVEAVKTKISIGFNAIKSIMNAILEAIKGIVTTIWNGIKTFISNTIEGIKTLVSSGLNAVKNTFSNIFNGIWNIVKGVCNSILGGIEKMVNGVITGLNNMINALNSLSFTVPDWVPELGGKSFGFNIPNIGNVALPRLAQGGYVKANTPQLAVVGDNRTQGEIISPENKMYEVMIQALESFFEKFLAVMPSNEDRPIIVQLVLDGDFTALAQVLKPYIDEENTRRGVQLVVGGAK